MTDFDTDVLWTPEQVEHLQRVQSSGDPYTCGGPASRCIDVPLEPTPHGWLCPSCGRRRMFAAPEDLAGEDTD
jgi:hypothetical protein